MQVTRITLWTKSEMAHSVLTKLKSSGYVVKIRKSLQVASLTLGRSREANLSA